MPFYIVVVSFFERKWKLAKQHNLVLTVITYIKRACVSVIDRNIFCDCFVLFNNLPIKKRITDVNIISHISVQSISTQLYEVYSDLCMPISHWSFDRTLNVCVYSLISFSSVYKSQYLQSNLFRRCRLHQVELVYVFYFIFVE